MAKGVEALASCKASCLILNHGPKGHTPEKIMNKIGEERFVPRLSSKDFSLIAQRYLTALTAVLEWAATSGRLYEYGGCS